MKKILHWHQRAEFNCIQVNNQPEDTMNGFVYFLYNASKQSEKKKKKKQSESWNNNHADWNENGGLEQMDTPKWKIIYSRHGSEKKASRK